MTEYTTPLCKAGEGSHREQWPMLLIAGLILLTVVIHVFLDSLVSLPAFLLALPLLIPLAFMLMAGWLEIQQLLAKARITSEGATITRPLSRSQHLTWSDIQQVCICLYNKGIGEISGRGHPQLVFVLPGAKQNAFDRWKTHSPFQHRRLIAIDYDEQIDAAVRALCPIAIVDLRETPPYR